MDEENFNSMDEKPVYSHIPPDEPPKKSGAGLAVAIILILILVIAGAGAAAILLLNNDSRANAKALKEKTPAEYLLWVEEKGYDAQRTKITNASKEADTAKEYPNGLTQMLLIDGMISDAFADELDLDGEKSFALQIDTSASEALLGAAASFTYGGNNILSATVSADFENQKGMLQIPGLAEGWYDFSELFAEGTVENPFLSSVGSALKKQSDLQEDGQAADPLEGINFSEDLYTSLLSYFDDYKLTQKKSVKATGVESSYTQVQASMSLPAVCDMLPELLTKIRDSAYFMNALYGDDETAIETARNSLNTLIHQLPAASASFTDEDLLTYTVWVDNSGKVKGRELSMTSSGQSVFAVGYKITTAKKNIGYSVYIQIMGTSICDIHGTAEYKGGTFSGNVALNIPTDLDSDVYMDPLVLNVNFDGLGTRKDGGFYGDFIFSMSMPEEIIGSSAAYNMERYKLKFSLPKDSDKSELTMSLLYKEEERASLHFAYSSEERFSEPSWPAASDTVYTSANASGYFSRENLLTYLDLIEQRMDEPELDSFFDALRTEKSEVPPEAPDFTDTDDPDLGGGTTEGTVTISSYPTVMVGTNILLADQLPFYFTSFLEEYQIYYQSDLDYYDEDAVKDEILNSLHKTLACAQAAAFDGMSLTEAERLEVDEMYDSWINYSYAYDGKTYDTWPWDKAGLKQALTSSQLAEKYKTEKLKSEGFDEEAILASVSVPKTYNLDEFVLYKDILDACDITEDEMRIYLEDSITYYNETITQEEKQTSIEEDNLIIPWLDSLELSHPEVNWDKFYELVTGGSGYIEWYTDVIITPDNSYYPEEFKSVFDGIEDGDMTHIMEFDDSFLFFYQWESYEDPDEYEYARTLALNEAKETAFEKYYEDIMNKYSVTTMFGWDDLSPSDFVYED